MSLHHPIVFFIRLLLFPLSFLIQGVSAEDPPAALLLCNWKYRQLTPLLTPEADVTAMKAVLEAHNPPFEVTVVANGSKAEMETAIKTFTKKHADNPVVLVYASGHGLQVGGINYLTGVETDLRGFEEQADTLRKVFPNEESFRAQVLAAQSQFAREQLVSVEELMSLLGTMSSPNADEDHVKMVFLDACREPFPEINEGAGALAATKSVFGDKGAGGLTRVTERPGIFVGMSAAANQVAQQSDSGRLSVKPDLLPALQTRGLEAFLWEHYQKGGSASDLVAGLLPPSFFTERLAGEIARGGSLEEVFNRTGSAVRRDSLDLKAKGLMSIEQTPAKYSLYYGAFRFWPNSRTPSPTTPGMKVTPTTPLSAADRLRAATKESPFVNSLGLEFVPVPGKEGVWMCRTETRVRDFRAYAQATDYVQTGGAYVLNVNKLARDSYTPEWELDEKASWEKPGFPQTEDHAVVCVSWEEARAMAAWLSKDEPGLTYRLPADAEWSAAVGSAGKYPWGNSWPPPVGAGNYLGKEGPKSWPGSEWNTAYTYDDGAERTARVATYSGNRFGFFDLGGNVWEWCEDQYKASMNDLDLLEANPPRKREKADDGTPYRVVRGGSWYDSVEFGFRSSFRGIGYPTYRLGGYGFRLVVSVGAGG